MSCLGGTLGNILIKHNDRWRGNYYLKDDLTFTTTKSYAARFYLLKSGDTTILNGDRISINSGNRTIVVNDTDTVSLIDRAQLTREPCSFIITNGSENTDPVTYESPVFLITDRYNKTALKYEWGMDIIESAHNEVTANSHASNYKPHSQPSLVNDNYGNACEIHTNSFQFYLEQADTTTIAIPNSETRPSKAITETAADIFGEYKRAILIMLLLVILVLCVIASR